MGEGERQGRGGRRVVLWFGVPRAKDGIEGDMVSVLLDVARVGARAWCSCLPRVEPPWATGVARSVVDCVSYAVQRRS